MSADAWRVCPKCNEAREKETLTMEADVEASYGKVPPEEYIRKLSELNSRKSLDEMGETTLREDYEIGIDEDGEFFINYRGGCTKCKFHFEYEFTKRVYP